MAPAVTTHPWRVTAHSKLSLGEAFGLCFGYENGAWRSKGLLSLILDNVADYALTKKEQSALSGKHATILWKALAHLYNKNNKGIVERGEIGELLLHVFCRDIIGTLPIITTVYYKMNASDPVKGFDCIHFKKNGGKVELWLGESKFYSDHEGAIKEALKSISSHLKNWYLAEQKTLISSKLESLDDVDKEILKLFSHNTSLDDLVSSINIPIFITYNSETISKHKALTDEFKKELDEEISTVIEYYKKSKPKIQLNVVLIVLPLKNKQELVFKFDAFKDQLDETFGG